MEELFKIIVIAKGKRYQLNLLDKILGIINKQFDFIESLVMSKPNCAEMFEIEIMINCSSGQVNKLKNRIAGYKAEGVVFVSAERAVARYFEENPGTLIAPRVAES